MRFLLLAHVHCEDCVGFYSCVPEQLVLIEAVIASIADGIGFTAVKLPFTHLLLQIVLREQLLLLVMHHLDVLLVLLMKQHLRELLLGKRLRGLTQLGFVLSPRVLLSRRHRRRRSPLLVMHCRLMARATLLDLSTVLRTFVEEIEVTNRFWLLKLPHSAFVVPAIWEVIASTVSRCVFSVWIVFAHRDLGS